MFFSLAVTLAIQGGVSDLPKGELPKRAHCVVCEAMGSAHGEEKPVAGVEYRGKRYFFCNGKEVADFKKDPEGFLPPVLPRPMPNLTLVDTKGTTWTASSFRGKTVLIDWWATWCGPCKDMMPVLDRLIEEHRATGVELLSVSIDEKRSDFEAFVKKAKFAGAVALDETQQFAQFRIKAIPALFLVKDGQIVMEWRGKQRAEIIEKAILATR